MFKHLQNSQAFFEFAPAATSYKEVLNFKNLTPIFILLSASGILHFSCLVYSENIY